MGSLQRRDFLQFIATGSLALPRLGQAGPPEFPEIPAVDAQTLAADEAFWSEVGRYYPRTEGIINLEHGYWGKMALPVLEHYQQATAMVNRQNSYYARRDYPDEHRLSEARVAEALGVEPDEIVLTRNATEAVHNLIRQYRGFGPGAAVLFSDVDYPAFQRTMEWLEQGRGVETVRLVLPARVDAAGIVQHYRQAFDAHPNLKLMLLTHASNQHGLVLPVAAIAREARSRGIDVICDSAQSWGLLDFQLPALEVEWAAFNLHKWIGSPVGVGALYMKRGSLDKVAPYPGEHDESQTASRIHTATSNFAAMVSVPAALEFHDAIGGVNKEARLRYLRGLWTDAASELSGIEVLGGLDEASRSGLGAFRLEGQAGAEQNNALQRRLEQDHGIFTVARHGLADGSCIRVTPQVFTSASDIDRLVQALHSLSRA